MGSHLEKEGTDWEEGMDVATDEMGCMTDDEWKALAAVVENLDVCPHARWGWCALRPCAWTNANKEGETRQCYKQPLSIYQAESLLMDRILLHSLLG